MCQDSPDNVDQGRERVLTECAALGAEYVSAQMRQYTFAGSKRC
jgi:hypothetical protein